MTAKPDKYLETEHLQKLIDGDFSEWDFYGALYGFRDGTIDDRTGEIWCAGRADYDKMLTTYDSKGVVVE